MCYFLTVAIPESAIHLIKEVTPTDLRIWPCENNNIMKHVGPCYRGYVVTTGMCSCDLCHGESEPPEVKIGRLRQKYQKKGWSEAKINRAISEASAAAKVSFSGIRADARSAIAQLVAACGAVYLFLHSYRGDQTTEDVAVNVGPEVRVGSFSSGDFMLEPDVLVKVVVKKEPSFKHG